MSIYGKYLLKTILHSFQLTQVTRHVAEVIISTKGVSGEIPEDGQSGIGSTPMGTLDQKGNLGKSCPQEGGQKASRVKHVPHRFRRRDFGLRQ